jgi:hypothetical protein
MGEETRESGSSGTVVSTSTDAPTPKLRKGVVLGKDGKP